MKELIVLSGFARVGKDTVGEILVENHGFTQVAYADQLRAFLYEQDPIVGGYHDETDSGSTTFRYLRLRDVIDQYGWQGYKDTRHVDEIRRLITRTGTEAGRDHIHPDVWINATFQNIEQLGLEKVVITDGRFNNELNAGLHHGGEVWRIERPGIVNTTDHPSETEAINYPNFNKVLNNAGTIVDLTKIVARAYADFEESLRQKQAVERISQGGHGPVKGDGSITSVNVPKARSRM